MTAENLIIMLRENKAKTDTAIIKILKKNNIPFEDRRITEECTYFNLWIPDYSLRIFKNTRKEYVIQSPSLYGYGGVIKSGKYLYL